MKRIVPVFAIVCLLMSCNVKKSEELVEKTAVPTPHVNIQSKNTLGKETVYKGTLPCAECKGIETVLKIYEGNGTMESHKFEMTSIYKGKGDDHETVQQGNYNTERGFEDDVDGTIYVLNWDKPDPIYYGYKSSDPSKLYLLDNNREIIKSDLDYFLIKK